MNHEREVEWTVKRLRDMMAWCRDNRMPLIHRWIDPVLNMDGEHVADEDRSCGTRGFFGHYANRSGSFPYNDDEVLVMFIHIRDRDLDLWKLRFT